MRGAYCVGIGRFYFQNHFFACQKSAAEATNPKALFWRNVFAL